MSKHSSLILLKDMGFNIPKLLRVIPSHIPRDEKLRLWIAEMEDQPKKKVSLRTQVAVEDEGKWNLPHYPNIDREYATKLFTSSLIERKLDVLIFEGINPRDCVVKGNLCIRESREVIVEFIEGPGTVRDLTREAFDCRSYSGLDEFQDMFPFLLDNASLRANRSSLVNKILEWSLYKVPVGILGRPDIYWELREWQ